MSWRVRCDGRLLVVLIKQASVQGDSVAEVASAAGARAEQREEDLPHIPQVVRSRRRWIGCAHGLRLGLANAEIEFQRAIALNRDYPTAHAHYGWYLSLMGRTEEAIAETRRPIDLDPLSTEYNHNLGLALHRDRRFDQAVAEARRRRQSRS